MKRPITNHLSPITLPLSLCLGVLVVNLSGCANGQYIGPSITASAGYEGATLAITLYGPSSSLPPPGPLPSASPKPAATPPLYADKGGRDIPAGFAK